MMKKKIAMMLAAPALLIILANSASASLSLFDILTWVIRMTMGVFSSALFYPTLWLTQGLTALMKFNPTVFCYEKAGCTVTAGINSIHPYMMQILIPVYIVAMMFTAIFFIAKSGSPRGRVRARKMLLRMIMGMLVVIYAPMIYQGFLDISYILTTYFLSGVSIRELITVMAYGPSTGMCYMLCCMSIAVIVSVIILLTRMFYVYIYALFFPIIIFLYFFEVTKPYGSKYLKEAVKWIFVPPLQALILYLLVLGPLNSLQEVDYSGIPNSIRILFSQMVPIFVVLGGLITMCAAPMIMTNIMEFIGTAIFSVGLSVDNVPIMALGGLISGQGPSAFSNAHAHFSRVRAHDSAMAGFSGDTTPKSGIKATRSIGSSTGPIEGFAATGGEEGASGGGEHQGGSGVYGSVMESLEKTRGRGKFPTLSEQLAASTQAKGESKTTMQAAQRGETEGEGAEEGEEKPLGGVLSKEGLATARKEGEGIAGDIREAHEAGRAGGEGAFDYLAARGRPQSATGPVGAGGGAAKASPAKAAPAGGGGGGAGMPKAQVIKEPGGKDVFRKTTVIKGQEETKEPIKRVFKMPNKAELERERKKKDEEAIQKKKDIDEIGSVEERVRKGKKDIKDAEETK